MMPKRVSYQKKKSRYHQVSFYLSITLSKSLKSKGGELNFLDDLEKWKTSDLSCSMTRPNCLKREKIIL